MQKQEPDIEARLRTLRVLWFAMLSNVGVFFVFLTFAFEPVAEQLGFSVVSFALAALGTLAVIISFPLKQKMLQLSVEQQKLDLVQQAFVLSWAICEAAALFGILDRFLTGNRYYFVLLLMSAAGIALNFPKRDHLLSATYKTSSQGTTL
jgi:hypothetical protein